MKISNLSLTMIRIHLIPVLGLLISASVLLMSCGGDQQPVPVAQQNPVNPNNPNFPNGSPVPVPTNNPYMNSNTWGSWGYIVNGQLCFKDSNGNPNPSIPCTNNFQNQGTYATYTGQNGQVQVVSLLGPTYPNGYNNSFYNTYYMSSPYWYGYGYYPWYNNGSFWLGSTAYSNYSSFSYGGYFFIYF